MPSPTYITGTVTVTNANATVTGAGTAWALEGLEGGLFCCSGVSIPIASVTDDDTLVLDLPWPGTTGSGKAYSIWKLTGQASLAMEAYERIAGAARRLEANSYIDADVYGTTAQKASFDAAPKDFKFLDTSVVPFQLWVKASATSGDWDGPNAFGQGETGAQGDKGWAPVYALVSDGARRVKQLVAYVGGAGSAPTANIGDYVGAAGYTSNIASAVDVRGQTGALSGLTTFWQDRTTLDSTRPVSWSNLADDPVERVPYPPALDLRLTDANALLPEWFSRLSTGKYFDAQGVLRTALAGVPRFDHDPATGTKLGLLIEGARTNLVLRSQEIDNAAWTGSGLNATVANAAVAPDATTTADKIVENSSNSQHVSYPAANITVAAGSTYTASFFYKAAGRTKVVCGMQDGSNNVLTTADLTGAGSVTTAAIAGGVWTGPSARIKALPNGWYRVEVTATLVGSTSVLPITYLHNGTTTSYTGDGTSGVYPWGIQVELGVMASSYIPTSSAAATRAADVITFAPSAFGYNELEGTLFVEWSSFALSGSLYLFALANAANTNVVSLRRSTGLLTVGDVLVGGAAQAGIVWGSTTPVNTISRAALAYKASDFAMSVDGGAASTDLSGSVPTSANIDRVDLGNLSTGSQIFGHLRRVVYANKRFSNTEIQLMTAA